MVLWLSSLQGPPWGPPTGLRGQALWQARLPGQGLLLGWLPAGSALGWLRLSGLDFGLDFWISASAGFRLDSGFAFDLDLA